MSAARDYHRIQRVVLAYQKQLHFLDEEIFQRSPSEGVWSYSEVYFHIFDASILSLNAMTDTVNGKGERRPTAFIVKLILFFGSLPPGKRFKAPKKLAARLKKISKAEAFILIDQFLIQLETDYTLIKNSDQRLKSPHPRMGYFSGFQWLRFIWIHLNHHLQQLHRIERSFQR